MSVDCSVNDLNLTDKLDNSLTTWTQVTQTVDWRQVRSDQSQQCDKNVKIDPKHVSTVENLQQ